MKRLFQALKDIYKDADASKRHLLYASLLILPSFAGAVVGIIDKDTPNEIMGIAIIAAAVLGIISIVPMLFSMGTWVQFCQDRFSGILGFPKLNSEMFVKGLKVIPIALTWGVYYTLLAFILFILPMILIIAGIAGLKSNPLAIIGFILLLILLYILLLVVFCLISPFVGFVFLKYAKTEEYTADLFNPFAFVKYIKKAFKRIIMIALKLLLFGMIMGLVLSVFYIMYSVVVFSASAVSVISTPDVSAEKFMYTPGMLFVIIGGSSILAVIQAYASAMIGFAGVDNYIEVYKEEFDK